MIGTGLGGGGRAHEEGRCGVDEALPSATVDGDVEGHEVQARPLPHPLHRARHGHRCSEGQWTVPLEALVGMHQHLRVLPDLGGVNEGGRDGKQQRTGVRRGRGR